MKTLSGFFAFILLFGGCLQSVAQTTGSFNTTIIFGGGDRTLSCYVPANYQASNKYRLIVALHGLGDNSSNYRNALINSLSWPAAFANTIIVCPDGGDDRNKDFYTPAGDEKIIEAGIKYITENYTIDTTAIILQGFSLGGRSAMKYGLDNPTKFKGLLLNTPALQGLADMNNNPVASLVYNYNNSSAIPIFITVGETDYLYVYTLDKLNTVLKNHNAKLSFTKVSGMGHNIPGNEIISGCINFFNQPATANISADLFEKKITRHFCEQQVTGSCVFRNTGDTAITSVELNIQVGNVNTTKMWNGNLASFQHAEIPFEVPLNAGGAYDIKMNIAKINGEPYLETLNNLLSSELDVAGKPGLPFYYEGFESSPTAWKTNSSGSVFEWYKDNTVKRSGDSSIMALNTILVFYTQGDRETFSSPLIDISSLTHKTISFDYAYNYHKYTPPYFTAETIFADTLEISVSTDCGNTFQHLFYKGGADLATTPSPILNPLNVMQCMFTPKTDEWQKLTLDLSAFASAKNAIIQFAYISGMGGSINIDNISTGSVGMATQRLSAKPSLVMYPNPASGSFQVTGLDSETTVHVYDQYGKKVITSNLKDESTVNTEMLSNGVYLVEIIGKNSSAFGKLIIAK